MGEYVFKLPDVGEGIAEAEIVQWYVAPGDVVTEDQPLVDVMTDKATVEMTSPVNGVIKAIHGAMGDLAPVGSVLITFEVEGGEPAHPGHGGAHLVSEQPAPAPTVAEPPAPEPQPAPAAAPVEPPALPEPIVAATPVMASAPVATAVAPASAPEPTEVAFSAPASSGHVLASPAVRARAKYLGLDLSTVRGSGPEGRIEHRDLDQLLRGGAAIAAAPPPALAQRTGETEIKIIGLRRRIAEKMQEAKRRIPHFTYVEAVDVTELETLRAHMNATRRPDQPKLSLPPFMIRALVKVLPEFPQINATFDDDAGVVTRYAAVHMGVATQTDNGLMVPVIRHAEAMDVWALAREIARLAAAARDGSAKREELSGSTLTLTSLGPLGGVTTTPVINRPEVGIIGPNNIVDTPVVRGGQVAVRKMMNISSSFDHRVVDGYDAALFISKVKAVLEHPATIFMD
jgi:2-oxoisovalerate dehydrogenase E2 component (dihydrolipoyl transacylase)